MSEVKASTWVKQVAKDYEVTESTVWKDWARRDQWIPELFANRLPDHMIAFNRCVARHNYVIGELVRLYQKLDHPGYKLSALARIADLNLKEIELYQTLGAMPKEPDVTIHEVNWQEQTQLVIEFIAENDPNQLGKLRRFLEANR